MDEKQQPVSPERIPSEPPPPNYEEAMAAKTGKIIRKLVSKITCISI